MVHPYAELEGTPLWNAVELAIGDLVQNADLIEQTPRAYIVGYICQGLLKARKQVSTQLEA
jgi:hypothetical protein